MLLLNGKVIAKSFTYTIIQITYILAHQCIISSQMDVHLLHLLEYIKRNIDMKNKIKTIIIILTFFICYQYILTSCSFPQERPIGIWENEDKSFVFDFADGYSCDDMCCSIEIGENRFVFDSICFAVVEPYVSLGNIVNSESSKDEGDTYPVFSDEITFLYSYGKNKLVLEVVYSSNEYIVVGTEFILSSRETGDIDVP